VTEWPVELRGVTETVVSTKGPNGRWNLAALGVHAPALRAGAERASGTRSRGDRGTRERRPGGAVSDADARATARTFGGTRTRRNFAARGGGYVSFVDDPVVFAEAALSVVEREEPIPESAAGWARVRVECVGREDREGTTVRTWTLEPREAEVVRESVPTTNRGYGAVVEGTVAASRLGVSGFDEERLRERLSFFHGVCERCGGARERAAFAVVAAAVRERVDDPPGWTRVADEWP